jgi:hypothetical protein
MYIGFTRLHCILKPTSNSDGLISCCNEPTRSSPVSLGLAAPTALTCGLGAKNMLLGLPVINNERAFAGPAFTGLFHQTLRRLAAPPSKNNQENRRKSRRRKKSFQRE